MWALIHTCPDLRHSRLRPLLHELIAHQLVGRSDGGSSDVNGGLRGPLQLEVGEMWV